MGGVEAGGLTLLDYGLPAWRQMYDRVKRAYGDAFDASNTATRGVDAAYAFFVFCYHLKDWIKNDHSVEVRVRGEVEQFVKSASALGLAGDIANGVKHLARNRPARVDNKARIEARGARLGVDFGTVSGCLGSAS